MKRRSRYITNILLIMLIIIIVISGCRRKINGSYILSLKEVKGHEANSVQVTFYNADNRAEESASTMLSSKEGTEKSHIQLFMDILKESDEVSGKEEIIFSPPSQSTHRIIITFDNESVLEFYYSIDNNWLIWSNTSEQKGKNILKYHFMSPPPSSMGKWLSLIKS